MAYDNGILSWNQANSVDRFPEIREVIGDFADLYQGLFRIVEVELIGSGTSVPGVSTEDLPTENSTSWNWS